MADAGLRWCGATLRQSNGGSQCQRLRRNHHLPRKFLLLPQNPRCRLTDDTTSPKADPGSKQSRVIAMLQSPTGATIAAMMKTTGWQQHSVRGFLAGVVRKRLKLKLSSKKVDGNRVYRIAGAGSGKTGARPTSRHPERHAARQDRSCTAGPKRTQCRDRALARSRHQRASGSLAQRLSAAATPSPAPSSSVSRSGLSAAGRTPW